MKTVMFKRVELERAVSNMIKCAQLPGKKFSYALTKTIKSFNSPLREINEFRKGEYEKARLALCIEYSMKDANNHPMMQNNNFMIEDAKQEEFTEKMNEISAKYPEDAVFMETHVPVEVHELKEEDLPDTINAEQRFQLEFMIETEQDPELKAVKPPLKAVKDDKETV